MSFATIASKFGERTDPAALVIGPTGLALGGDGTLFVADTVQSRIAAIPNAVLRTDDAGDGETVAQGQALKQPLGLAIAPNGNVLTVNGADGLLVETTPAGRQVGARFVDVSHSRNGAGTLFGLSVFQHPALAASGTRALPPARTGAGAIAFQHPALDATGLGRLVPLAASRTYIVPLDRRVFSPPIDARSFDVSLEIRSFLVWPTK